MAPQLVKWSFGLMWGMWAVVFIIQMIGRRSWVDLLMIPVVLSVVAVVLLVIFKSGWVVAGFILLAHIAFVARVIVAERKKKLRPIESPSTDEASYLSRFAVWCCECGRATGGEHVAGK